MKNKKQPKIVIPTDNDVNVLVEEQPKELYFYGKKEFDVHGKKIERRVTYVGIQTTPGAIRIGRAVCSDKEKQFDKKKSKMIAAARANKRPEDIIYLTDDTTPTRQFIARAVQLLAKPDDIK